MASRRIAERLISEGRVTVNGNPAVLGDKAVVGVDRIEVDGAPVHTDVRLCYYALNKPRGVISTTFDDLGTRRTVLDLLDPSILSEYRIFPVGRLDMDSTGLILLTNDGILSNRLLHPSYEVTREYVVEVEPVPTPGDLARLRKGVDLEEGNTGPAKVSLVGSKRGRARVRMSLHTGKNRQIRRSFDLLGFKVITLNRVRFGSLGLGNLRSGEYRELSGSEVRELYRRTGWKM